MKRARLPSRPIALWLSVAAAIGGCTDSVGTAAPARISAAAAPAPAEPRVVKACELIPAAEMSAILGGAVSAESNERSTGKTLCTYTAQQGISPYLEFSIEWGMGAAAMTGVGMLSQREPGIASPYEGLGDQAVAVGPALMIRTGDDLVTLVFSGVDEVPAKAKKIFDIAKGRM